MKLSIAMQLVAFLVVSCVQPSSAQFGISGLVGNVMNGVTDIVKVANVNHRGTNNGNGNNNARSFSFNGPSFRGNNNNNNNRGSDFSANQNNQGGGSNNNNNNNQNF